MGVYKKKKLIGIKLQDIEENVKQFSLLQLFPLYQSHMYKKVVFRSSVNVFHIAVLRALSEDGLTLMKGKRMPAQ